MEETRTAIVTGGTKGIGFATAGSLAAAGFRVVITGRTQATCDDAARAVEAAVPNAKALGMALDLASFASVRKFAEAFLATGIPLQVLVHNAGQVTLDDTVQLTADGIQTTLATNVIGPFLLTHLLLDRMLSSKPARIVNVGSRLHLPHSQMKGEVNWDWDNLKGEKSFNAVVAYKNSKLATMWFTYELNRRLAEKGITVNAVCPGFVPETLAEHQHGISRFFFKHVLTHFPGTRTVKEAAANTTFAATAPLYSTRGGVFIGEEKEIPSSDESHDEAQAKRFWKFASDATGVGDG